MSKTRVNYTDVSEDEQLSKTVMLLWDSSHGLSSHVCTCWTAAKHRCEERCTRRRMRYWWPPAFVSLALTVVIGSRPTPTDTLQGSKLYHLTIHNPWHDLDLTRCASYSVINTCNCNCTLVSVIRSTLNIWDLLMSITKLVVGHTTFTEWTAGVYWYTKIKQKTMSEIASKLFTAYACKIIIIRCAIVSNILANNCQ